MADVNIGSASTATEKNEEKEGNKMIVCQNGVVLQRPPSGRSQKNNHGNHVSTIKTTHLLFEPTPPPPQQLRSSNNSRYRRIHSAHGRIEAPSQPNRTQNANVKKRDFVNKTRPQSAIEPGGRKSVLLTSPVPKQLITLNVTHSAVDNCKETKRTITNGCVACNSEKPSLQHSHTCSRGSSNKAKKTSQDRPIPKGIIQLAPWLTENVPEELCGVDPKTCLMFLPCVSDMDELPPELPLVQHYDECVIPYTVIPPAPKPFDPKKLFHYDVERHIQEAEAFYDRRNIYSVDGRLLHEERRYNGNRTCDIIKQEIDDLEGLLAGIGRADGNSIVVQYQEEINKLQRDVRTTLLQCPKIEEKLEEEPPDLMGLRAFIREREEVISRIKSRREACVAELDSMALEADVGMTMQKEVLQAFKYL